MIGIVAVSTTVMMVALLVSLAPQPTAAVTPAKIQIDIHDGATSQTVIGTSQHRLVLEALASGSAYLHQPFTYHVQGDALLVDSMFGKSNTLQDGWIILLNDTPLTNLHSITFSARDRLTITRTPLK
jgi:hypothetical protein